MMDKNKKKTNNQTDGENADVFGRDDAESRDNSSRDDQSGTLGGRSPGYNDETPFTDMSDEEDNL